MKNTEMFSNGVPCSRNAKGQMVDDDGFMTSSFTKKKEISWSCVSVKKSANGFEVRNTNDQEKTTVKFNQEEWLAFVQGVKKGEFDV